MCQGSRSGTCLRQGRAHRRHVHHGRRGRRRGRAREQDAQALYHGQQHAAERRALGRRTHACARSRPPNPICYACVLPRCWVSAHASACTAAARPLLSCTRLAPAVPGKDASSHTPCIQHRPAPLNPAVLPRLESSAGACEREVQHSEAPAARHMSEADSPAACPGSLAAEPAGRFRDRPCTAALLLGRQAQQEATRLCAG